MDSVLGYNVSQFVSAKLKSFSAEKNLDELHQRLLAIFGESGSMLIELRIVNILHSKLGGCFEIDHHIGAKFLERNCRLARNAYQDSLRNSS